MKVSFSTCFLVYTEAVFVTWRRVEWRLKNCKDDVRSKGLGLDGWYEPIGCMVYSKKPAGKVDFFMVN